MYFEMAVSGDPLEGISTIGWEHELASPAEAGMLTTLSGRKLAAEVGSKRSLRDMWSSVERKQFAGYYPTCRINRRISSFGHGVELEVGKRSAWRDLVGPPRSGSYKYLGARQTWDGANDDAGVLSAPTRILRGRQEEA